MKRGLLGGPLGTDWGLNGPHGTQENPCLKAFGLCTSGGTEKHEPTEQKEDSSGEVSPGSPGFVGPLPKNVSAPVRKVRKVIHVIKSQMQAPRIMMGNIGEFNVPPPSMRYHGASIGYLTNRSSHLEHLLLDTKANRDMVVTIKKHFHDGKQNSWSSVELMGDGPLRNSKVSSRFNLTPGPPRDMGLLGPHSPGS